MSSSSVCHSPDMSPVEEDTSAPSMAPEEPQFEQPFEFFPRPTTATMLHLSALAMLISTVLIFRLVALLRPITTDLLSPEAICLQKFSSASPLDGSPNSSDVDFRAYEVVVKLEILSESQKLAHLSRTHPAVYSTLETTIQALIGYTTNASDIYIPSPK